MNGNSPTIIRCKNIWKSFGEGTSKVDALKGVDLEIAKGEIHMLMGPSGSGKTTLISIIAGMLTETLGECWIGQVQLNHLPNGEKTRLRGREIGFVFQMFNLIPTLTIEENVSIPLILNNIKKEEAIAKAKEMIEKLGIGEKARSYPAQLSGGEQQRTAIARAMVHHPQIIVCDEPTSYLDLENGIKIMTLLRDLVKTTQVTLIVVTHDSRITHFADKINHLEDGKIIA